MSRTALSFLLAVAALFGTTGAATGPQFSTVDTFLTCPGPTAAQNANRLLLDGANPSWTAGEPTARLLDGDGCAMTDFPVGEVPANAGQFNLVLDGSWTGNLDTMVLDLYVADRGFSPDTMRVALVVDGVTVISSVGRSVQPSYRTIGVVQPVGIGAVQYGVVQFAFEGIGVVDDLMGPGDVTHDIRVYADLDFAYDGGLTWLMGTREVPSRITFNGDTSGVPALSPA